MSLPIKKTIIDQDYSIQYFMKSNKYQDYSSAIIDMHERGFDHDFYVEPNQLICIQNNLPLLYPHQFEVVEMHYFRGNKSDKKERMLYGIKSLINHAKGILLITSGSESNLFPEILYNKIQEASARQKQTSEYSFFLQ